MQAIPNSDHKILVRVYVLWAGYSTGNPWVQFSYTVPAPVNTVPFCKTAPTGAVVSMVFGFTILAPINTVAFRKTAPKDAG